MKDEHQIKKAIEECELFDETGFCPLGCSTCIHCHFKEILYYVLDDFNSNVTLPRYVKIKKLNITLRLNEVINENHNYFLSSNKTKLEYYRDAGDWSVSFKIENDKIIIDDDGNDHLNGLELIEVNRKEYENDNRGYI
jgi:hypothetical protein